MSFTIISVDSDCVFFTITSSGHATCEDYEILPENEPVLFICLHFLEKTNQYLLSDLLPDKFRDRFTGKRSI